MITTNVKPFVFVLMPFHSDFDDIYLLGIKAACNAVGAYCERVDEQIFVENILDRVYNQIAKADIVVSEMTGRNPNVFYETGYAHALNKRVILLTQNADDIPFDLKHYPHVIYGGRIAQLKTELEKRVKWCIDNPSHSLPKEDLDLELLINGTTWREDLHLEILCFPDPTRDPVSDPLNPFEIYPVPIQFSLHNTSNTVLNGSRYRLGIIAPKTLTRSKPMFVNPDVTFSEDSSVIKLPPIGTIFPDDWYSASFKFAVRSTEIQIKNQEITIRLYTELGNRDYKFWATILPSGSIRKR